MTSSGKGYLSRSISGSVQRGANKFLVVWMINHVRRCAGPVPVRDGHRRARRDDNSYEIAASPGLRFTGPGLRLMRLAMTGSSMLLAMTAILRYNYVLSTASMTG